MQISEILSYLTKASVDYEFLGDESITIDSVNGIENAQPNQFCYFAQEKLHKRLSQCSAGLLITRQALIEKRGLSVQNVLLVQNPHYVFAKVMQLFYANRPVYSSIDPTASLAADFVPPFNCIIGANSVISENVSLGKNCIIQPGAVVHESVRIGDDCLIGSNVVIHKGCILGNQVTVESGTVIGGDGFGWANDAGQWHKIPQIGRVVIGNRVSIGNNCAIDRGAIEDTVIEDDVIIDNLVHIAHNVVIGKGSAIAGQAGFAGSTKLGKYNIVAGQAGFAGHIETVNGCQFNAKSGVTHSIKESGVYAGFPAYDARQWQKNTVKSHKLDELSKQVRELQKQISFLQDKSNP